MYNGQGVKMRLIAGLLLICTNAPALKVDVTKLAAGTTIFVNLLEIKTRIQQAKVAAKAVKKTTVKVVRKVARK
jgi:hypothetical protein